ncbi:MAG: hypothetical protein IH597_04085 [Bacteroidales bacterium]|nr:hypothetical protein [Bacteroidales bacterium]
MQKTQNYLRTGLPVLSLLIVPVVLVVIGFTLRKINGGFSIFAIDPEFSYLYSGVLLAQGKINLFTDHPGTPLIVLAAIVSRIVHLFRLPGPFVEDVMQNPDIYLNAINLSMIVLIAAVVFIAGLWMYRKTGNLAAVLFLQISPFVAESVFSSLERYMPEPFFIAVVVMLVAVIVVDIHGKLNESSFLSNRAIIYGIIIGFGISLKFTFGPFLVIPLFLLGGFKKKLHYLAAMVISFIVFTFPLLKRGKAFFEWIKSIVMHSGKYGSGEANVLDPNQFFANLKSIYQSEKHLIYALALAAFVLIISLLPVFYRRIKNKKYLLALAAIGSAMVLGILAISKHYAAYYLIPYSLLTLAVVYLSFTILLEIISYRKRWLEALLYTAAAIIILSNPISVTQYRVYKKIRVQKQENKQQIISDVDNLALNGGALLLSADNWHISKESGLFFGMLMTPGGSKWFGPVLNKLYPDTYLFKEWKGSYFDWFDKPHEAGELLEKYSEITAIAKHYNPGVYEQLEATFTKTGMAIVEVIYQEPTTKLQVYRIARKSTAED